MMVTALYVLVIYLVAATSWIAYSLASGFAKIAAEEKAEARLRILAALADGPKTVPEIGAALSTRFESLYTTVRAMEREGLLVHREEPDTTGDRGGRPRFVYSLAPLRVP